MARKKKKGGAAPKAKEEPASKAEEPAASTPADDSTPAGDATAGGDSTPAGEATTAAEPAPEPEPKASEPAKEDAAPAPTLGGLVAPARPVPDEFVGAGAAAGLEVWHVEALKPVKLGKKQAHTLSEGDAYIVLHTLAGGGGALRHLIHFWLGASASPDEIGGAAALAVGLDDALGGRATQFRQTQGMESAEFAAAFAPAGFRVRTGSLAASALKKVSEDAAASPVLYHVHGRRKPRALEVPAAVGSLNSGDCFVLDTPTMLYVWSGNDAAVPERGAALGLATALNADEHAGRCAILPVDEDDLSSASAVAFYSLLGVTATPVTRSALKIAKATPDDAPPALFAVAPKLFDITGESPMEVSERPLSAAHLKQDKAFALLSGDGANAWLGRKAPDAARSASAASAAKLLASLPEAPATVRVIKQGLESPLFKQHFGDWDAVFAAPKAAKEAEGEGEVDADSSQRSVEALLAEEALTVAAARKALLPPGNVKVYRVQKMEPIEWPRSSHGEFFSGDCFIVHYSSDSTSSKMEVIFFWQGRDASIDERGASALLAKALDESLCESVVRASQVRVVQGAEPPAFANLFRGGMVVHSGGMATGFTSVLAPKGLDGKAKAGASDVALYQVRGSKGSVCATQVEAKPASLNSGDAFVLVTKSAATAWTGSACSSEEAATAEAMRDRLAAGGDHPREKTTVAEGEESDGFWEALGGKGEYAKPSVRSVARDPRLFQIIVTSGGGGDVVAQEICHFTQDDLCDDDVCLLDTYTEVYVWLGRYSTESARLGALSVARKYVKETAARDGRSAEIPVSQVPAGKEPPMFTSNFVGWDAVAASRSKADEYYERIANLQKAAASALEAEEKLKLAGRERAAKAEAAKATHAVEAAEEERQQSEWVKEGGDGIFEGAFAEKRARARAAALAQNEQEASDADLAAMAAENEAKKERVAKDKLRVSMSSAVLSPVKSKVWRDAAASDEAVRESAKFAQQRERARLAALKLQEEEDRAREEAEKAAEEAAKAKESALPPANPAVEGKVNSVGVELKYSPLKDWIKYEALKELTGADGIEPTKKEDYLDDAEFKEVFGMDRAGFAELKLWRRQQKKKSVGLF